MWEHTSMAHFSESLLAPKYLGSSPGCLTRRPFLYKFDGNWFDGKVVILAMQRVGRPAASKRALSSAVKKSLLDKCKPTLEKVFVIAVHKLLPAPAA